MPLGSTKRRPAPALSDSAPMSTARSAWSMRFGAHLRHLGMDVMLLEAIKIGTTLYEHASHLSPEDAAVLYAADHAPGYPRADE